MIILYTLVIMTISFHSVVFIFIFIVLLTPCIKFLNSRRYIHKVEWVDIADHTTDFSQHSVVVLIPLILISQDILNPAYFWVCHAKNGYVVIAEVAIR